MDEHSIIYNMPLAHFWLAKRWLKIQEDSNFTYFVRMGPTSLIQLVGSSGIHREFQEFIGDLWVVKLTTTFPLRHRKLVKEELEAWSIPYRKTANPFVFEIVTSIDEREMGRFKSALKVLTKKGKRGRQRKNPDAEVLADLLGG